MTILFFHSLKFLKPTFDQNVKIRVYIFASPQKCFPLGHWVGADYFWGLAKM